MTIFKPYESCEYGLNTEFNKLTLQERKDAFLLLLFLNITCNPKDAFKHIKTTWIDTIQPVVGMVGSKKYNVSTSSRHATLKRLKTIYNNYVVKAD